MFLNSCGQVKIKLDYTQLEDQYKELTPYWEYIIDNKLNTKESARFAVLYKEARDLIVEYKDPRRQVDAGGIANFDGRNDTQILWELRNSLRYASGYTNKIK